MKDDKGRDMWEVEAIIADEMRGRGRRKQQYFLIKWKNYPLDESTWEPASYIRTIEALEELVKEYDERESSE